MRAIVLENFGSPDVLQFHELPEPTPPPGGYVVRVMASAVNYADVVERRGLYKKDQTVPCRLGKEAAGIVIARDPDAVEFEVGDAVIVVCVGNGCYAEVVAAEAHEVLRPPRGLSFVEMAAFSVTFATAWYAMFEIARVRPGESALIQAAAGGVGSAAVALARTSGCAPIIGTAGGSAKCAVVASLGADLSIDYASADLRAGVLDMTHELGVDFCLESVGGEVYDRSLEVLAPMGRLVIVGFSSIGADYATKVRRIHPLTMLHRSILVGGLNLDNLAFMRRRTIWEKLVAHAEEHDIRPLVAEPFPFERIRDAHHALESRRTAGKVVLVVDASAYDVAEHRSSALVV